MYCYNCGKMIDNNSTTCKHCGFILNSNLDNSNTTKSTEIINYLEYNKLKKDISKAMFLWFFFGSIGLHRAYIGHFRLVIIYNILVILGIIFSKFLIVPVITVIILFIDGFHLQEDIDNYNENLKTYIEKNEKQNIIYPNGWGYVLAVILLFFLYGTETGWFMNYSIRLWRAFW